jgi:predicted  nucleic acid-binding Zn-ribbon protein
MPTSIDPIAGDNEIECARCGAIFSIDLTRCPNCGVNLYEPDNDDRQARPHPNTKSAFGQLGRFARRLFGEPHPADELFRSALDQAALFTDLLRKVSGDRQAAERLIEFEQSHQPNGTRQRWIKNAIRRWEDDNCQVRNPIG